MIRPRCWIEMNFKWESLKKWVARGSLYLLVNYKLIVIIIILERKEVSIHRLASLVRFINFALIARTLELDLTEFFRFFVSGKIISIKNSVLLFGETRMPKERSEYCNFFTFSIVFRGMSFNLVWLKNNDDLYSHEQTKLFCSRTFQLHLKLQKFIIPILYWIPIQIERVLCTM